MKDTVSKIAQEARNRLIAFIDRFVPEKGLRLRLNKCSHSIYVSDFIQDVNDGLREEFIEIFRDEEDGSLYVTATGYIPSSFDADACAGEDISLLSFDELYEIASYLERCGEDLSQEWKEALAREFTYGNLTLSRGYLESLPAPFRTYNADDTAMEDIVRETFDSLDKERHWLRDGTITRDRYDELEAETLERCVNAHGIPYWEDIRNVPDIARL